MAKATDIPLASRRAVRERDGQGCRCCGRWSEGLHLHHLVYRSQERNHHAPENLVSLCYDCHRLAHTRPNLMRGALQWVLDKPWLTAVAHLRQQGVDIQGLLAGTL